MEILAFLAVCVVAFAGLRYYHRERSVSELLVDFLYSVARVAYCVAKAADAALVCYRETRSHVLATHMPDYAHVLEVPSGDRGVR